MKAEDTPVLSTKDLVDMLSAREGVRLLDHAGSPEKHIRITISGPDLETDIFLEEYSIEATGPMKILIVYD